MRMARYFREGKHYRPCATFAYTPRESESYYCLDAIGCAHNGLHRTVNFHKIVRANAHITVEMKTQFKLVHSLVLVAA